jgi:hypothetical protein
MNNDCIFWWRYTFPAARLSNPLDGIDLSRVRTPKWIQDMLNSGDLKYARLENIWITPPPHMPDQLGFPPETFHYNRCDCVESKVKKIIFADGHYPVGVTCDYCPGFLGYPPDIWPPKDWNDPKYGLGASGRKPSYFIKTQSPRCLLIGKGPQAVIWEKWKVLIRNIRVGSNKKPQEYYTQGIFLIPTKTFYDIECLEIEAEGFTRNSCEFPDGKQPGTTTPVPPLSEIL